MLLVIILSISGAEAIKSANRCSWPSFCRLLEPRPESLQIYAPGFHFVNFWSQRQKVSNRCWWLSFCWLLTPKPESLQINNPGYHFVDGAKARKSSNRCAWLSFRCFLEPMPESLQIDAPGNNFVDIWSQAQKVFKSMLLAIILSTSGTKVRKSINRWSGTHNTVCTIRYTLYSTHCMDHLAFWDIEILSGGILRFEWH